MEPEQEDIGDKEDKARGGRVHGWDLDMTAAGDDRRAEGDRAEAGVAASVVRDSPIGEAVLSVPEEGEGRGDSTYFCDILQRHRSKKRK